MLFLFAKKALSNSSRVPPTAGRGTPFKFAFSELAEGEGLEPPRAYARRISSAVHYHSANPPAFTLLIFFHKFYLIFF